jgi:hypothetical protein
VPDEETQNGNGFSAEYVEQLRKENASWRKKVRELEVTQTISAVGLELARRGVEADASWVKLEEGQSVQEAVESFVERYPRLVTTTAAPHMANEEPPAPRTPAPAPMSTNGKNVNTPGPKAGGLLAHRSPEEIKADPVSRKALQEYYRDLLRTSSNQKDTFQ